MGPLPSAYAGLVRSSVQVALTYRGRMVLWALSGFFPLLLMAVWLTVVDESGPPAGWTTGDFLAYYAAAAVVWHLSGQHVVWEWDADLRSGDLSTRLLRPLHPFHQYAAGDVGHRLVLLVLAGAGARRRDGAALPGLDYDLTPGRALLTLAAVVAGLPAQHPDGLDRGAARVLEHPDHEHLDAVVGHRLVPLRLGRAARADAVVAAAARRGAAVLVDPRLPRRAARRPARRRARSPRASRWASAWAPAFAVALRRGLATRHPAVPGGGRMSGDDRALGGWRRYGHILAVCWRAAVAQQLEYRADLVAKTLMSTFWLAWAAVGVSVYFRFTGDIAGWSYGEVLVVVGLFFAVNGVRQAFLEPNLALMREYVQRGTLDHVLTQPVDSQVLVSLRHVGMHNLVDPVLGLVLVGWGCGWGAACPRWGASRHPCCCSSRRWRCSTPWCWRSCAWPCCSWAPTSSTRCRSRSSSCRGSRCRRTGSRCRRSWSSCRWRS